MITLTTRTKLLIFCVCFFTLIITSCTSTRSSVIPDLKSNPLKITTNCGNAIIRKADAKISYEPAGDIYTEFVRVLKKTRLFAVIYNNKDKTQTSEEILMKAHFNTIHDPKKKENIGKAVLTGCLLMLPAPGVWYQEDYILSGVVTLSDLNDEETLIQAQTKAKIEYQLYSGSKRRSLEFEILSQARNSLYRQLLIKIQDYCNNLK